MKYILSLFLVIVFFAGCEKTEDTISFPCSIEGVITSKVAVKDGHEITLIDQLQITFYAIISIPNLDTSYTEVFVGERIYLRGECFELNGLNRITPDYMKIR